MVALWVTHAHAQAEGAPPFPRRCVKGVAARLAGHPWMPRTRRLGPSPLPRPPPTTPWKRGVFPWGRVVSCTVALTPSKKSEEVVQNGSAHAS